MAYPAPDPGASWQEVLCRLRQGLLGRDLYQVAREQAIVVWREGKLNKGWVGQTVERAAGLPASSAQRRDGSDFELKSTTLVGGPGQWQPKETIKITAMNPRAILEETFETSALWEKLRRWILVGVHHADARSPVSPRCEVIQVSAFEATPPDLQSEIRAYWQEIQGIVACGEIADYDSQGSSGGYLQLRPTGNRFAVHTCPVTGRRYQAKAFYATKRLVRLGLGL
jgi:DNA mismatch repair protein MutH